MTGGRASKPRGGKASRQKGDRVEREIVNTMREHGIKAQRVPLSGASGGDFTGDIVAEIAGSDWRLECKAKKGGFKEDYKWLGPGIDAVIKKADRQEPLITLHLGAFLELVERVE